MGFVGGLLFMSLKEQITTDMKEAMKAGESERVTLLRMLLSALFNEAIALKKKEEGVSEEEGLTVLSQEAKRRQEAASEYEKAGRDEQAAAEQREFEMIQAYLPEQLSDDDLRDIVRSVISETGAQTPQDMGRVMGVVMGTVKGQADGNVVRAVVEELLST